MSKIYVKKLFDKDKLEYVALFNEGDIDRPIALLTWFEAKRLVYDLATRCDCSLDMTEMPSLDNLPPSKT